MLRRHLKLKGRDAGIKKVVDPVAGSEVVLDETL